jgi:Tfp pilus assembly protein PilP
MLIAFLVFAGCDSGPAGPTAEDFNNERNELMANLAKKKNAPKKVAAVRSAEAPIEPDFGGSAGSFTYDAAGSRDPFRSVEWEEKGRRALLGTDRSPLEQYDVNQMSLLAVIWNTGTARALVQDPAGKSYIIGNGTRMGRNEGRITAINDNLVVVKETYVDFLGQETTKDIELRIRLSEGG